MISFPVVLRVDLRPISYIHSDFSNVIVELRLYLLVPIKIGKGDVSNKSALNLRHLDCLIKCNLS